MSRTDRFLLFSFVMLILGIFIHVVYKPSQALYPSTGKKLRLNILPSTYNLQWEAEKDTVLVIAYTTQCGSCRAMASTWSYLQDKLRQEGIQVVGLSSFPEVKVREFEREYGFGFPTLLDTTGSIHKKNHILAIPQLIWTLADGTVVRAMSGERGTESLVERFYPIREGDSTFTSVRR